MLFFGGGCAVAAKNEKFELMFGSRDAPLQPTGRSVHESFSTRSSLLFQKFKPSPQGVSLDVSEMSRGLSIPKIENSNRNACVTHTARTNSDVVQTYPKGTFQTKTHTFELKLSVNVLRGFHSHATPCRCARSLMREQRAIPGIVGRAPTPPHRLASLACMTENGFLEHCSNNSFPVVFRSYEQEAFPFLNGKPPFAICPIVGI